MTKIPKNKITFDFSNWQLSFLDNLTEPLNDNILFGVFLNERLLVNNAS